MGIPDEEGYRTLEEIEAAEADQFVEDMEPYDDYGAEWTEDQLRETADAFGRSWLEQVDPDVSVALFRGLPETRRADARIGGWWTDNPFLALRYAENDLTEVYLARLTNRQIAAAGGAMVAEEGDMPGNHYVFPEKDPRGARPLPKRLREALEYASAPASEPELAAFLSELFPPRRSD